tara:strand:+ start:56 stop:223 length:168 start_codon:yes stop_codon:yes gene_type:complete
MELSKKELLFSLKHYDNTDVTYKITKDTEKYMCIELKYPNTDQPHLIEWGYEEDA